MSEEKTVGSDPDKAVLALQMRRVKDVKKLWEMFFGLSGDNETQGLLLVSIAKTATRFQTETSASKTRWEAFRKASWLSFSKGIRWTETEELLLREIYCHDENLLEKKRAHNLLMSCLDFRKKTIPQS